MAQFADQVRIRLSLQLIKSISRIIQKLFKCFDGKVISLFRVPTLLVLFKNLDLNLNNTEFVIGSFSTSLQTWHRLSNAFE